MTTVPSHSRGSSIPQPRARQLRQQKQHPQGRDTLPRSAGASPAASRQRRGSRLRSFEARSFEKGATRPSSPALLHPPNGFLSRLPLNSVGAGGSAAGKEASTEMPEPREGPRRGDRGAKRRRSLRFQGKGVPGNTHPNASRVSSTSPSIVGSGPDSGPLMVLRPKAVQRSKKPAGNLRHGAKVPGGVSAGTA